MGNFYLERKGESQQPTVDSPQFPDIIAGSLLFLIRQWSDKFYADYSLREFRFRKTDLVHFSPADFADLRREKSFVFDPPVVGQVLRRLLTS